VAAVVHANPENIGWLGLVVIGGSVLLAGLALAGRRVRYGALAVALALLLAGPAIWSVDTLGHRTSATFPAGGPAGSDTVGAPKVALRVGAVRRSSRKHVSARMRNAIDTVGLEQAIDYVDRHGGGTIGVRSQQGIAAPAIIATGAHVAGLGGFSGAESEPTVSWFAHLVATGRLRWIFSTAKPHIIPGYRVGAARVLIAATNTCRVVPPAKWTGPLTRRGPQLYDCRGYAGLIRLSQELATLRI
jgi:hypothetical protein